MSHSRVLAAPVAALLLAFVAGIVSAQPANTTIDAIGTLDYTHGRSQVTVGSWVKYHITAKSEMGVSDDYMVTILIPGEERWWGEDCFWVETWTEAPHEGIRAAATLMSYAIFDDSLAVPHTQLYQRKTIAALNEDGTPVEQVFRLPAGVLQSRQTPGETRKRKVDELGTDSVRTVKGVFYCKKTQVMTGTSTTAQGADSSEYSENRDIHVGYWTPEIPVTGLAREDIDYGFFRRTWQIGRSQDSGPMRTVDRSRGTVELVDYGHGGLKPKLVPADVCRSIAEQDAEAARAKTKPPGRPATARPPELRQPSRPTP